MNPAMQFRSRRAVEGQAEDSTSITALVAKVAVSLRRDRCFAAAWCRHDVDESILRSCCEHLRVG